MSLWFLLSVPGSLLALAALLFLSAVLDAHVLSPRSMIVSAARARRTEPEYTEAFVAREFDRLLRRPQES